MPILAFVNNGLKYCSNQLRLSLRYRLSSLVYNKYIDGLNQLLIDLLFNPKYVDFRTELLSTECFGHSVPEYRPIADQ